MSKIIELVDERLCAIIYHFLYFCFERLYNALADSFLMLNASLSGQSFAIKNRYLILMGLSLHKINTFLEIPLLINTEAKFAFEAGLVKIGLSPKRIDLVRKIRHSSTCLISFY
jgi:hypothetical protein